MPPNETLSAFLVTIIIVYKKHRNRLLYFGCNVRVNKFTMLNFGRNSMI